MNVNQYATINSNSTYLWGNTMKSIQTKISITIVALMLIVTATVMVTVMRRNYEIIYSDSNNIIRLSTELYAEKINNAHLSDDELRTLIAEIDTYGKGNAFLLTKEGDIVYHVKYPDGIAFNDLSPEDQEHFADYLSLDREDITRHWCDEEFRPCKTYIKELDDGRLFVISVSRFIISRPYRRLFGQLLLTSLIIVIASVVIGILWVGSIVKPLRKMTQVADEYAKGDYSEKMTVNSKDEVGRLSRSLEAMSESLVNQIEIADAANKAKSAFLSNMSHEIRTPITAVLGLNEMILREADDPEIIDYSENIKASGNTLLGLINDILDFSKIEAGKIDIVPVDYDMSSLINDLVNMVSMKVKEKGLSLALDFDPKMPKLLNGDEVRIKQIITNLLTNAVKYTEKGGIRFGIGYEDDPDDTDTVIIKAYVKDTGIGIKEEDMDKLFSKFERIEEKRNRNIEGTGLGLNITESLLELMGSSLEVESVYGEGSVFSFALKQKVVDREPLGDYKEAYTSRAGGEGKYKSAFTAPQARVLMVDDNATNLLVFKSLLKETRMKIDTALSGDECLKLCAATKYDIIFLDHMMPGKDGIETIHELKKMENSPNADTRVICLTANAVSGAREGYLREGFDDYLTKPIDPVRLEKTAMMYLPKDKLNDPAAEDVLEFDPDAEDVEVDEGGTDITGALNVLNDQDVIDAEKGINYCGGERYYLNVLESYRETVEESMNLLDGFLEDNDIDNYVIRVHSVKSLSRTIGAAAFSELAADMEKAGKSRDMEFIRQNHDELKHRYAEVKGIIDRVFA